MRYEYAPELEAFRLVEYEYKMERAQGKYLAIVPLT